MDKKKKGKSRSMSPIMRTVLAVIGFCVLYFLLLGFTLLPGVADNLDFSVRKRAGKVLTAAFPEYQIGTIAANRSTEKSNILTIGYKKQSEIEAYVKAQKSNNPTLTMSFNNAQFRIRELVVTPFFLLILLFLFSPVDWKWRGLGLLVGCGVLYFLLALKLRGMVSYEMATIYQPELLNGWLRFIPYFSSPGLVFAIVVLIWLALFLPFLDRKRVQKLFS